MKKYTFILLALILSSYFASQVQSSFGKVDVQSIKIPTQNGQWVVADLFKPYSATAESPAPLVIVIPGFQRSKETLSNISIELSKRGIVVMAIDPYAQGQSSSSFSKRSATNEGYGMFALVNYAYDTNILNYIDKNRIGSTGHSAGGLAAMRGAQYFGKEAKKNGLKSKLHSVFVSGMLRMGFNKKDLKNIQSNVGVSYALYDEGAWQNELKNGDLKNAPEILRLINIQDPQGKKNVSIEMGKYYGLSKDNSKTIIFNEKLLHPFQPYSPLAITNQINFFLTIFDMSNSIPGHSQSWYWKELLTLISLICGFILIIPITKVLLKSSFFRNLIKPLPTVLPRPKGKSLLFFWLLLFGTILIAGFSFIPLSEASKLLFYEASNRQQTWFFPQRMNNALLLWATVNGCIGILLFYLSYRYHGRINGIKKDMLGLEINFSNMIKTILLSIIISFSFFLILNLLYYLFHVDYRFIFIAAKVFRPETLISLLMYLPFFFIFFFSNSLRINSSIRFRGNKRVLFVLLSVLSTCGGLILILLIQYTTLWLNGTVFWTIGWLYVNLLFAIIPILLVLPFFQRFFFNMTGRVYLGPITMSIIFVVMLLSNSVYYYPF